MRRLLAHAFTCLRPASAQTAAACGAERYRKHFQEITLGSSNNRAGAVLDGMRVVTALVQPTAPAARRGDQPHTYRILTDRFDLAAELVVQCYL